jgi:hypothetical protein
MARTLGSSSTSTSVGAFRCVNARPPAMRRTCRQSRLSIGHRYVHLYVQYVSNLIMFIGFTQRTSVRERGCPKTTVLGRRSPAADLYVVQPERVPSPSTLGDYRTLPYCSDGAASLQGRQRQRRRRHTGSAARRAAIYVQMYVHRFMQIALKIETP